MQILKLYKSVFIFSRFLGTEFDAVLMNDKGETPLQGGLLIAQHGKGHYLYTGLSFFRQLPAGVPGAIKLFTNMLSVSDLNKTIELMKFKWLKQYTLVLLMNAVYIIMFYIIMKIV